MKRMGMKDKIEETKKLRKESICNTCENVMIASGRGWSESKLVVVERRRAYCLIFGAYSGIDCIEVCTHYRKDIPPSGFVNTEAKEDAKEVEEKAEYVVTEVTDTTIVLDSSSKSVTEATVTIKEKKESDEDSIPAVEDETNSARALDKGLFTLMESVKICRTFGAMEGIVEGNKIDVDLTDIKALSAQKETVLKWLRAEKKRLK